MIRLIDTHAHLYDLKFRDDLAKVVANARKAGVEKIYLPNIDVSTIDNMLELEAVQDGFCKAMMGIHPCSVKDDYLEALKTASDWWGKRDFCAVGEIGIDLYWDTTYKREQIQAFRTQINWAKEMKKPVVIHCRESMDITIDIVREEQDGRLKGVFHCFGGDVEQAKQITDLNFLMGIGGIVTFKKAGLDKVLPHLKLESLLLETDSPYLAPVPFRGKRNEPAYLTYIAEELASLMQCQVEEVAESTSKNALNLFENG
jgi:TatD DNase family protein